MLDASSTISSGVVDQLRFMGVTHEEFVQAPVGLLRQDVTLSAQVHEYQRRKFIMNEYRRLIETTRDALYDNIGSRQGGTPSPAKGDASTQSQDGGQAPSLSQSLAKDDIPASAALNDTTVSSDIVFSRIRDPVASAPATKQPDGNDHSVDFYVEAEKVPSNSSPRKDRLATQLLRAALAKSERYLPCYYCAKDVLHAEFESHLMKCRSETQMLLRKSFFNPLRFAEFVPQVPVPPLNCDDDELDDYAVECSKSLGRALVECVRCRRKYNIHELQKHTSKCVGRSSGEVLGHYEALLRGTKSQ